ncbi:MAG: hypothetical protein WBE12_20540, partial [Candidatus Acidiferrum sp.]
MTRFPTFLFVAVSFLVCMAPPPAAEAEPKVQVSDYGKTTDGISIYRFVLTNKKGVEAVVISYGAALVSLKVPDRDGKIADVVLGFENLEGYEQGKTYFGGTIGRYGNRIAKGEFSLDGMQFHLPVNDGPNSLHGGTIGFNKRVWTG